MDQTSVRACVFTFATTDNGPKEATRPMLLVCHSLGGLILKQALCIANEQLYRYEHLINATSGIIFISTPHFGSGQPDAYDKVMSILKATSKLRIKPTETLMSTEVAVLTDLSVRFEAVRILAPILSIHESRETRLKDGRFKHKNVVVSENDQIRCRNLTQLQLVDKLACTLNAQHEQFVAMPFDHTHICQFMQDGDQDEQKHQSQKAVVDFIRSVLIDAKQSIEERLEASMKIYSIFCYQLDEFPLRQTFSEIQIHSDNNLLADTQRR